MSHFSGDLRAIARSIVDAAIDAVDPAVCVQSALPSIKKEMETAQRVIVIGAGKAAGPMAQALEHSWGDRIACGAITTKYGHSVDLERIECHEAGHPVPDQSGVDGAKRIAAIAQQAGEDDLVVCVLSGGASALMPLPAEPIVLLQKQETTSLLLASGATIHEINIVRKHLSALKGGRLAQLASPARLIALVLSDVVGDDLDIIGSGPTAPDRSTFQQARAILEQRGIWGSVPRAVRERIALGEWETPKPGDAVFERVRNMIVGNNRLALEAGAGKARELGFTTLLLSSSIEGEAREIARMHAAILKEICATGNPIARPACVLSGGETTVTLHGKGTGGRNQEWALAAAVEIAGLENVAILSVGTDGTDGPTDAAGAFADGETLARAQAIGMRAESSLAENDSYPFFERLGDLLITGPTRTNVMDLQILLAA